MNTKSIASFIVLLASVLYFVIQFRNHPHGYQLVWYEFFIAFLGIGGGMVGTIWFSVKYVKN